MADETPTVDISSAVLLEHSQLRIPSQLDWIEPTAEHLKTRALLCGACDQVQAGRLFLALHEALTNSVIHGNLEISSGLKEQDQDLFSRTLTERAADPHYGGRSVHIGIVFDGQHCQWALTDEGPGFDFEAVLNRPEPSPEEMWSVSGRGIALMRALVDEVRYEAGGRRVILTLNRTNCPEKRLYPRQPLHQCVQVLPLRPDGSVDWDAAYQAVLQNLSRGGVGLLQSHLSQAERVLIGTELAGQTVYLPAQVCHCQTIENNLIELGCRFLLPEEAPAPISSHLQDLDMAIGGLLEALDSQQEVPLERRQQQRVSYTGPVEIVSPSGDKVVVGHAWNISRGGIALLTAEPIPLGEQILALPRPGKPLRVRTRIVRCRGLAEGLYDVAARFQELA